MTMWVMLRPDMLPEDLGLIPYMLDEAKEDKATKQFDDNYDHGGGWRPFNGFVLNDDNSISYNGDPDLKPIAMTTFKDELILVYPYSWVAVVQKDRSFEICRMD